MSNRLNDNDPLGKIMSTVNKTISVFGLVGVAIVIWMMATFFIEGC